VPVRVPGSDVTAGVGGVTGAAVGDAEGAVEFAGDGASELGVAVPGAEVTGAIVVVGAEGTAGAPVTGWLVGASVDTGCEAGDAVVGKSVGAHVVGFVGCAVVGLAVVTGLAVVGDVDVTGATVVGGVGAYAPKRGGR